MLIVVRLMKGLLCGALLSHRSAGGRWCRKAPKGGKSHRRWLITVMLIMPYDTENKSRNVLASPLGEEDHEVAKGCTRVRMIMTLDMDVTAERRHYNTHRPLKGKRLTTFCASFRSGSRRLAVRKMIECHISAQPCTPFCHYVAFPLKGKRENRWHWILCYI